MKKTGWRIMSKLPITYKPYHFSQKELQEMQDINKLKSDESVWPPELHREIEDACGIYLAQQDELSFNISTVHLHILGMVHDCKCIAIYINGTKMK